MCSIQRSGVIVQRGREGDAGCDGTLLSDQRGGLLEENCPESEASMGYTSFLKRSSTELDQVSSACNQSRGHVEIERLP